MTRRASDVTPAQHDATMARDDGRCVRGGEPVRGFRGVDFSTQHRVARGMGGSRHAARPSALILLCGSATTGCHGWVEAHPDEARRLGYRVPPGVDPEAWPVLYHGREWRQLTDDGWVSAGPREGTAAMAERSTSTTTTTQVKHFAKPLGRAREPGVHLSDLREFVAACDGLPNELLVHINKGHLDEGGRYDVELRVRLNEPNNDERTSTS